MHPSVKSWHDLFFEEIEGGNDFLMSEVANVEHAHEVIRADLLHLVLNLSRNAVGVAGDHITALY